MQQRLCLAHTLVHDPQVLLLDEPASGLDPRARVELRELLRELRSLGKTILDLAATSSPSSRSCAPRRDRRPRPGARPGPRRRHRAAAAVRRGAPRPRPGRRRGASRPPGRWFAAEPDVASAHGARRRHDRARVPRRRRRPPRGCSPRRSARGPAGSPRFARAASDLEELFLQVTAPDREPGRGAGRRAAALDRRRITPMSATPVQPRRFGGAARRRLGGHRRGRRQGAPRPDARPPRVRHPDDLPAARSPASPGWSSCIMERTLRDAASGLGGRPPRRRSAQGIFAAHARCCETLHRRCSSRPASTAGAISLEREKQTLDLLVTTPISSLAIVLGKLLSAR